MARKNFNVFSLSFLDVMACGLGATILFLMLISAQVRVKADRANTNLRAEASLMEEQVLDARKDLLRLQDTAETREERASSAADEVKRLQKLIAELRAEAEANDKDSSAKAESVEQLRADVERLKEGNRRLVEARPEAGEGQRIRSFVGAGNRQYLTGMRMGGRRVLILVDSSASMLGRTYANVVRYRLMTDERKVRAPKWRQTLATVDWLTTQIDPGARFQIYTFNELAASTVAGSEGTWFEARNSGDFDAALAGLRKVVPNKGTSLYRAFEAARQLKPVPDNIFLITDGLPTQGKTAPAVPEPVRADRRANYLRQSLAELPSRVPVNVILLPMEGDPEAAIGFWNLAIRTGGSFLAPSHDWP
ncbi:MAG: VWA domain-containing protein [Gammaproteobacteria bacterium]